MIMAALSRWLVLAAAGDAEAEFVLGDLEEEYGIVAAARGRGAAEWWLAGQAIRSASPLLTLRIRSGEMTHALVVGTTGAALPHYAADSLWRFVHSHIPLKDGVGREPWELALNLALLCLCAFFAGESAQTRRRAAALAVAAFWMTAAAIVAARGSTPPAYIALALFAAPAAVLARAFWRRFE